MLVRSETLFWSPSRAEIPTPFTNRNSTLESRHFVDYCVPQILAPQLIVVSGRARTLESEESLPGRIFFKRLPKLTYWRIIHL